MSSVEFDPSIRISWSWVCLNQSAWKVLLESSRNKSRSLDSHTFLEEIQSAIPFYLTFCTICLTLCTTLFCIICLTILCHFIWHSVPFAWLICTTLFCTICLTILCHVVWHSVPFAGLFCTTLFCSICLTILYHFMWHSVPFGWPFFTILFDSLYHLLDRSLPFYLTRCTICLLGVKHQVTSHLFDHSVAVYLTCCTICLLGVKQLLPICLTILYHFVWHTVPFVCWV